MPRKSKNDQDRDYLRSAWEELAATELAHAARVVCEITAGAARGTFTVALEMRRDDTPLGLPALKARQTMRYPTAQETTFTAWLWGFCMRFSEYVDEVDVALRAPQED